MSTYTSTNLLGGDWSVPSNWNQASVPNDSAAVAVVPGAASTYTVKIASGESEIVNTITLGDLIIGNVGPTLDIAGTLIFAGTSPSAAMLSGTIDIEAGGLLEGQGGLGTTSFSGKIINSGTLLANGFAGDRRRQHPECRGAGLGTVRHRPRTAADPAQYQHLEHRRGTDQRRPGQRHRHRPHRPRSVRICSRSAIPQELARDPRLLGVAVRTLELLQSEPPQVIHADDARLTDGFHDFEMSAAIRWTDGNALVPTVLFEGMSPATLSLRLDGSTQYPNEGIRRAA